VEGTYFGEASACCMVGCAKTKKVSSKKPQLVDLAAEVRFEAPASVTDGALPVELMPIIKLHKPGRVVTLNNVKRWHYIVLAGLILVIVYVYLHRQELGLVGPHSFTTGDVPSADLAASDARPPIIKWQAVDRSGDGFTVEMPSDVKEIQIPAYNERGGAEQVDMIFSNPSAEIQYSLAWADNPPVVRVNGQVSNRVLDMARDDALARTQTNLISESRTNTGGFPSRDFVGRNVGGGIMNVRLICAGKRLYMLSATFPSVNARRDQDVTRFLNSFKMVGPVDLPEDTPSKRNQM